MKWKRNETAHAIGEVVGAALVYGSVFLALAWAVATFLAWLQQ